MSSDSIRLKEPGYPSSAKSISLSRVLRCVLRYSIVTALPMQQSPSSSNESDPSTQSSGDQSLQPIAQFDHLSVSSVSHSLYFHGQTPIQPRFRSNLPFQRLTQALSCLRAGIGVEVWSLETIWPGVSEQLFWYDWDHPNTLSSAATAGILAIMCSQEPDSRRFDCPVFVAEARHGWPRTCNNVKSTNMSELRRHLKTRPGRGYTPQLAFLGLCRTCNDDFIDKEVFESQHGYKGEFCNNRKPGRRRANAQVQWQLLYHQVEAAMTSQYLQARTSPLSNNSENGMGSAIREENDNDSALPGPSASMPLLSTPYNNGVEPPASDPILRNQNEAIPYLTPYQLIVDSDSGDEGPSIEPQHVSFSCIYSISRLIDVVSRLPRLLLMG